MTSIRGLLISHMIWKNMNHNAPHKKHSAARHRWQNAIFNKDRLPEAYTWSAETTPGGTAFQRVIRTDTGRTGRVLLYFHGGAYRDGLVPSYRNFSTGFFQAANGCETIYLDYRCAPDYQYPTQLNEALDLWDDLTKRQGYAPDQIILGGDSAGANLALALLLKLWDLNKTMPRAAFCISAWTDMTCNTQSFRDNYGRDVMFGNKGKTLTEERLQALMQGKIFSFLGNADRTDPYVSPIFGDYHGFPPMFFSVGTHEMLYDETLQVVEKLKACQVPVTCEIQPGMFHIYVVFARLVPEGKIYYHRLLDFIRANFVD